VECDDLGPRVMCSVMYNDEECDDLGPRVMRSVMQGVAVCCSVLQCAAVC